MSTSERAQVVIGQFDRTQDGELLLFIDRVVVSILEQRWLDQHGESESEPAVADAERFPAAA